LTRTGEQAPSLQAETAVPTAARMRRLGRWLAPLLRPGDLIVLNGALGAGKTTLVQGIGGGLGVRGPVTSPTFVIARIHPALRGGPDLVHADAYRLTSPAEVDDLDLDADLDHSVTVVEWGGGLAEGLAADRLEITIARPGAPAGEISAAAPAPGLASGAARDDGRPAAGGPAGGDLPGMPPGPHPGEAPAPGGCAGPGDEPRTVRLAGWGERWATAAESVRLAISGAAEAQ
jgi:tRNA threonylcarbamoyladenosine biosynthesis protein TsaE